MVYLSACLPACLPACLSCCTVTTNFLHAPVWTEFDVLQLGTHNSSTNYCAQERDGGVELPSCSAGDPFLLLRGTSDRGDRNKRRFRNLKRVTDDVRGSTAGSDVILAGLVTMGAPVLLISEEDEVSIQFSIFFMRHLPLPAWFPAKWNVFVASCPRLEWHPPSVKCRCFTWDFIYPFNTRESSVSNDFLWAAWATFDS